MHLLYKPWHTVHIRIGIRDTSPVKHDPSRNASYPLHGSVAGTGYSALLIVTACQLLAAGLVVTRLRWMPVLVVLLKRRV